MTVKQWLDGLIANQWENVAVQIVSDFALAVAWAFVTHRLAVKDSLWCALAFVFGTFRAHHGIEAYMAWRDRKAMEVKDEN